MNRKRTLLKFLLISITIFIFSFPAFSAKKEKPKPLLIDGSILNGITLRNIGPAIMGGRIDDFAVVEKDPRIIFVATASGGLWKTVNNGVTWEPVFDNEEVSSIGDVSFAPSNPNIVWVGTGEANNRQSSSWGNGVYKSTDGGKTWKHMGLRDTHHIARIVVHPNNPDIVYVAAVGRLWGPNKERGLFKTEDGGKTWKSILFINEDTGVTDVAIDYESPNIIYAASYQRRRTAYGFVGGGPHSAIYKSIDGGETWKKLTNGLPTGDTGRIGLDVYRKDSRIIYAIIENKDGGVFRSEDRGETWKKMSSTNPRPMYFSQIRIDPNNDLRIWVLGVQMYYSEDGGKTFRTDLVEKIHVDFHAMWINPENSDHIVLGSDGGIHISYDRGKTWDFINTIPLGQFYEVGYDMRKPYYVYGGLQDNGTWAGPSATRYAIGITNDDWYNVAGGDGFYAVVDPNDPTTAYVESQDGNLMRFNLKTGERRNIRPVPKDDKEELRFNWNSPILISPHNSNVIYYGGNKLFKSTDRGETWTESPDLTTNPDRDKMPIMGIIPDEKTLSRHDGVLYYGTITTITESPMKEGLLYVGTDDGNVQVSKDGGKTWKNITKNIKGVPPNTYVSRVVASRFEEGRVYVTFDGHRSNDFNPYVFVSEDYGETWHSISSNLPHGYCVNVIREGLENSNLLFVGTEFGAFFSIDRGKNWVKFKANLPTVPVDDIAIHPREHDLIFGTHGRSIWILDDAGFLEDLKEDVLNSEAYLFDIRPTTIFNFYSHKGSTGHKIFIAPNPPFGAIITYYLKEKQKEDVKIEIFDKDGKKLRELKGPNEKGINRLNWDLRYEPPRLPQQEEQIQRFFRATAPFVMPGEYTVKLVAGGKEYSKSVKLDVDPIYEITTDKYKIYHDILYELYRKNEQLTRVEFSMRNLDTQLKNIQSKLNKERYPQEFSKLEEVVKKFEALRDRISGRPGAAQFRGRAIAGALRSLYFSISGYIDFPTSQQMEQFEKLKKKVDEALKEFSEFMEKDIQELLKLLEGKISPIESQPGRQRQTEG
ncbi:MAG: VPS10 domain-containing protein [Candidatus Aminicenantia bacterium]